MLSWSCGVCVCGVYMTVCVSLLSVVRVREESVRSIKPYSNPRSSPTGLPGGSRSRSRVPAGQPLLLLVRGAGIRGAHIELRGELA